MSYNPASLGVLSLSVPILELFKLIKVNRFSDVDSCP